MHTVHLPVNGGKAGIEYAAMGIMFDTKRYTAKLNQQQREVIDSFFDDLAWEDMDDNGKMDLSIVNYRAIMHLADFSDRWTYSGSVTTPPCGKTVHWNVASTIYPISERHLSLFKKQLDRSKDYDAANPLSAYGNYREINPYDGHDLRYIKNGRGAGADHGEWREANDGEWVRRAAKAELKES